MGHLGFEPKAFRLKARYSTIELMTLFDDKMIILKKNDLFQKEIL